VALRALASVLAVALLGAGCDAFHKEGPEDPTPINPPTMVAVSIEYRQPVGCLEAAPRCAEAVVFYATWLPAGVGIPLLKDEGGTPVWRGRALGVPVNFPPRGEPYQVRVFDPHLRGDSLGGLSANRITVGSELLTRLRDAGTTDESALVYIDENGLGHNPF
jgi:hypothetical protein